MPLHAQHYLKDVRDQYEDYPYPKRDPENEKKSLQPTFYDPLDIINHYCFSGQQTFQDHFRVLVAGGGTGDATIFLAEQLRHTNAEIVYVDISLASMEIAKKRADIRKLTNITWHHHSLLDVADLGIGTFDYINCSGVLHHLADPAAGLQALTNVLSDKGAMGIMVYAELGRTGIYQIQELMRILCKNTPNRQEKVDICKEVLSQLPASNWFDLEQKKFKTFHMDLNQFGDIGIYDLLLHPQDRAYTVPQLISLINACGLQLIDFIMPGGLAKIMYKSAYYLQRAPSLASKVSHYDNQRQQAIAELMAGYSFTQHSCYLSKQTAAPVQVDNIDNIPFVSMSYHYTLQAPAHRNIYDQLTKQLESSLSSSGQLLLTHPNGNSVRITQHSYTLDLFRFMDGIKSTGEIINSIIAANIAPDTEQSRSDLLQQFVQLFVEINLFDWFLLRHKSVPAYRTINEIQNQL